MNKPHSLSQISIHGTDGSLSTFTLHDPASIQRILNELQHSHFFTRESIIKRPNGIRTRVTAVKGV